MRTETKELLGFNVPVVGIAETLKEAIDAAGSEEAVLKDYNANVQAHSHYTILRRAIAKKLEELTGIKRLTEGEGDKAKIVETEGEYVARLEEELSEETLKSHEKAIAETCAAIPIDYKPGTRGSGGSVVPAKKWLAAVDDLIAQGKFDTFCSKYGIDQSGEEEAVKIAAANKIKEVVTERLKAATKEVLSV